MLADSFAPGLHARRQGLGAARREGRARLARGEPRDDRRLGRVPGRRAASACCSTPSTSSTASRSTPATALDCLRAAAEAGAERARAVRHQRRLAAAADPHRVRGRARSAARRRARHPHPRRLRLRASPTRSTAVEAGATQVQGTINGIGERTGNANLITIIADLQLKMGCEVLAPERLARLTETAHFVDELLNRSPDPAQPYVGKHAFAHKAGLHAAGVQRRRADLRARRPGGRRQRARRARSPSSRARARSSRRPPRPASPPDGEERGVRPAGRRAGQGARARGLPVRGRRRLASSC